MPLFALEQGTSLFLYFEGTLSHRSWVHVLLTHYMHVKECHGQLQTEQCFILVYSHFKIYRDVPISWVAFSQEILKHARVPFSIQKKKSQTNFLDVHHCKNVVLRKIPWHRYLFLSFKLLLKWERFQDLSNILFKLNPLLGLNHCIITRGTQFVLCRQVIESFYSSYL